MDTRTGQLITDEQYQKLAGGEKRHYIHTQRDATAQERSDMQVQLYSPCMCGSGKKFKFCCKTKDNPGE
jgi:uncharacterized protein YchJ